MGESSARTSSLGMQESTGLVLSGDDWVRNHFEADRTEYEAMLDDLPITRGGRVLDAGCGPGLMFPALARKVGPAGRIDGVDIAPDFVQATQTLADECGIECAWEVRWGSVLELPYEDSVFDAIWCGNIAEYFDDDELLVMLREFARVTKPGGLVSIKDWDGSLFRIHPCEPQVWWHFFEAVRCQGHPFLRNVEGFFRLNRARTIFRQTGLVELQQTSYLIEHRAPLTEIKRRWSIQALEMFRAIASELELPVEDRPFWDALIDPEHPNHPIHDPDFLFGEANTLIAARVPIRP